MIAAPRSRLLVGAFWLTFFCHGAAMVAMALLLAPMLPGGGTLDDAARVTMIAEHPLRFRLGWLPWHVTALSDLLLALAFLRTSWVPRGPAWLVLALTVAALVPDQGSQLYWVTAGVEAAQRSVAAGDPASYLALEARLFPLTAAWAALLYTLGAIGWCWCLAAGGAWSRGLGRLSVLLWGLFLLITTAPLLPPGMRPPAALVAAGNALGFALMELWFFLVIEHILRADIADQPHGRWAPWVAPGGGLPGRALGLVAGSRALRDLGSLLPVVAFRSDIRDVIYVNYLVPAEGLEKLVPEGLELQRLGPEKRWTMLSLLTYRHGHFGPSLLGPLRRLWPSPVQSNWRIYVRDPRTKREGIYFVTNAITTPLHAIGARVMADGAPMHLARGATLVREPSGEVRLAFDPGAGSAPDLSATLHPTPAAPLAGPWAECFASHDAMLRHVVPQDRAMSTQPWRRVTIRDEIVLGIPIESCEPLAGEVRSQAAEALVGPVLPLCFRVPAVAFVLAGESQDRW
jgi:hypothetical protein